jgi:hypothetical protein
MRPCLAFVVLLLGACGSDSEHVGTPCTMASQCYPGVQSQSTIHGTVTCLTQYSGGYCTHSCVTDADCCAVAGECRTGFPQVCASFENQSGTYCFFSCADADIAAAPNGGTTDPNGYCQHFAGSSLTCRSTGGGSANRKFCG